MSLGRIQFLASLPYYRVTGPGSVIPGNMLALPLLPQPEPPPVEDVTRKGWGDLELAAAYAVPNNAVNLVLTGAVKVPTAENGLGTGASDYTVGAQASKAVSKQVIPFASLSYTLTGDSENYALQDRYAATAGVATLLGSRSRIYASYRYARNPDVITASDQRMQAGFTTRAGDNLFLGLYGSAGLSRGAPAHTVGLRLGLAVP